VMCLQVGITLRWIGKHMPNNTFTQHKDADTGASVPDTEEPIAYTS
jgi:hypothetical protein